MSGPILSGIHVYLSETRAHVNRLITIRWNHLHLLAFPAVELRAYFHVFSSEAPFENEFYFVDELLG